MLSEEVQSTDTGRSALDMISVYLSGKHWAEVLQTHFQILEDAAVVDVYACLGKRECEPSSSGLNVEFVPSSTGAVLSVKQASDDLESHFMGSQQDRLREYTYGYVMQMYNLFEYRIHPPVADSDCEFRSNSLRFRGDWTSILLQRRCDWVEAFCLDVSRHLSIPASDIRNLSFFQDEEAKELEVSFVLRIPKDSSLTEDACAEKLSTCRYCRVWSMCFEAYPQQIPHDLHFRFLGDQWERLLESFTPEFEEAALEDVTVTLQKDGLHANEAATMFLLSKDNAHLLCRFPMSSDEELDTIGQKLQGCAFDSVWGLYHQLSSVSSVSTVLKKPAVCSTNDEASAEVDEPPLAHESLTSDVHRGAVIRSSGMVEGQENFVFRGEGWDRVIHNHLPCLNTAAASDLSFAAPSSSGAVGIDFTLLHFASTSTEATLNFPIPWEEQQDADKVAKVRSCEYENVWSVYKLYSPGYLPGAAKPSPTSSAMSASLPGSWSWIVSRKYGELLTAFCSDVAGCVGVQPYRVSNVRMEADADKLSAQYDLAHNMPTNEEAQCRLAECRFPRTLLLLYERGIPENMQMKVLQGDKWLPWLDTQPRVLEDAAREDVAAALASTESCKVDSVFFTGSTTDGFVHIVLSSFNSLDETWRHSLEACEYPRLWEAYHQRGNYVIKQSSPTSLGDEELGHDSPELEESSRNPPLMLATTTASPIVPPEHTTLQSIHTVLPGDGWKALLSQQRGDLEECLVDDVSNACGVPKDAVTNVDFSVGSLNCFFDIQCPEMTTKDEIHTQLTSYAYVELWKLYGLHASDAHLSSYVHEEEFSVSSLAYVQYESDEDCPPLMHMESKGGGAQVVGLVTPVARVEDETEVGTDVSECARVLCVLQGSDDDSQDPLSYTSSPRSVANRSTTPAPDPEPGATLVQPILVTSLQPDVGVVDENIMSATGSPRIFPDMIIPALFSYEEQSPRHTPAKALETLFAYEECEPTVVVPRSPSPVPSSHNSESESMTDKSAEEEKAESKKSSDSYASSDFEKEDSATPRASSPTTPENVPPVILAAVPPQSKTDGCTSPHPVVSTEEKVAGVDCSTSCPTFDTPRTAEEEPPAVPKSSRGTSPLSVGRAVRATSPMNSGFTNRTDGCCSPIATASTPRKDVEVEAVSQLDTDSDLRARVGFRGTKWPDVMQDHRDEVVGQFVSEAAAVLQCTYFSVEHVEVSEKKGVLFEFKTKVADSSSFESRLRDAKFPRVWALYDRATGAEAVKESPADSSPPRKPAAVAEPEPSTTTHHLFLQGSHWDSIIQDQWRQFEIAFRTDTHGAVRKPLEDIRISKIEFEDTGMSVQYDITIRSAVPPNAKNSGRSSLDGLLTPRKYVEVKKLHDRTNIKRSTDLPKRTKPVALLPIGSGRTNKKVAPTRKKASSQVRRPTKPSGERQPWHKKRRPHGSSHSDHSLRCNTCEEVFSAPRDRSRSSSQSSYLRPTCSYLAQTDAPTAKV